MQKIHGFFAYPSAPNTIQETIKNAVAEINKSCECQIKTWQDCSVSGKIIIDVITRAIDGADLFIADLTGANPNVLFELGYAISKKKRVYLFLDTTYLDSKTMFEKLRILTTVGYTPYSNSNHIIDEFYKRQPWNDMQETIFSMSIEPNLNNNNEQSSLLYLKNLYDTEASTQLSRIIESFSLPTTYSDPGESSVHSLVWYSTKILNSFGVIVHLSGIERHGWQIHNSRYSFVSGLAYGFQKPLLMLSDSNYQTPIDYRDILQHYNSSVECEAIAKSWLEKISASYAKDQQENGSYRKQLSLASGLKSMNIGEFVAENEEENLSEYFIETHPFLKIMAGEHSVIVGRKGSGKTANLFMASSKLKTDKRNLVCVIKPVSYDIQGVVRLGKEIKEKDKKGFLAESLWKFLIYSEIAKAAYDEIKPRPLVDDTSIEYKFINYMENNCNILRDNFAVRLEKCINNLSSSSALDSLQDFQFAISETLHDGIIRDLRKMLGNLLAKRKRVIILMDNLDKSWERGEDLDHLSDFLLGLIRVAEAIPKDFSKKDHWREPVNISITIFLRSDIFSRAIKNASEPDKIRFDRLSWNDPEVLIRIIDKRLNFKWDNVFVPIINGMKSREYIIKSTLPRPRDLVYFTKSALAVAVNRGHSRVEEEDLIEAQKQYSQFVFEVIQVENGISLPELEKIMYEFVGRKSILTKNEIRQIISKSGIVDERLEYAIRHLFALSFLGIEVKKNDFRYCSNSDEIQKIEKLSERYVTENSLDQRYQIHNAFHSHLEITI